MAVQQAFKVRELMISVLPADVENEPTNCGYCTTCSTCTNCSNGTSCTSCTYRTTSNQLTEIVQEDDLSLLKQELELLLLK